MQQTNQLPHASVIICNYNYGHWITDAITSAARQDYPEKSIVVIDDCSVDDSVKTVLDLAPNWESEDRDDYVIYSSSYLGTGIVLLALKQNGGPSRARNFGIKHSYERSHIFAILDADDVWKQGKLSKSIAKILAHPEQIGGVYTDYDILNEYGVLTYESKRPYSIQALANECIIHSGAVISKPALAQAGIYNEQLRTCEDYDLWLRISDNFIFYHIPENLVIVRSGSYNSTNSVDKQTWENNYKYVKYNYFKRKGLIA